MGSRSPPNAAQPPAFFSKLTESTSAIVKSKKQEMIKKMTVVGNDGDFSKSERLCTEFYFVLLEIGWTFEIYTLFPISDAGQPGTEIFNMPASTTAGDTL